MEKMKKLAVISAVGIFEVALITGLTEMLFTEWYQSFFSDPYIGWACNHYLKLYLCWGIMAGICVGKLAEELGHKYYLWFFYGQFLTIIPVVHLYILHKERINTMLVRIKESLREYLTEKEQCEL